MKFVKTQGLFLLSIIFYCAACNSDRQYITRNKEFEFKQEGGKHFRFLYSRLPENDTIFTEAWFGDDTSLKTTTYTHDYFINEATSMLKGDKVELVSHSIFLPDESGNEQRIDGKIIKVEDIPGKYHGSSTVIEYVESLTKKTEDHLDQTYVSDTVFMWNGKELPAIKFHLVSRGITINRLLPIAKSEVKFTGATFFAKDLGFVGEYFTSDTLDDGSVFSSSYWLVGIQRLD